jgi:hypothetical protein
MRRPTSVEELLDIEAIRQLKGLYSVLLDQKRWDEWRELFTDDLIVEGLPFRRDIGGDGFVAEVKRLLHPWITTHHIHNGRIVITGENTARALWPMQDDIEDPELPPGDPNRRHLGYGWYEEEYRKDESGDWRISYFRLSRIRWENIELKTSPLGEVRGLEGEDVSGAKPLGAEFI